MKKIKFCILMLLSVFTIFNSYKINAENTVPFKDMVPDSEFRTHLKTRIVPKVENDTDILTQEQLDSVKVVTLGALWCNYDGIESLEGINNFKNITNIYMHSCSNINLKTSDFSGLTKVNEIWMQNMELDKIPDGFLKEFPSLGILYLSGNNISDLDADIFSKNRFIRELNLAGNNISSLPSDVFSNMPFLNKLYLDNNPFESIEEDIFANNANLEIVTIWNSKLKSIPEKLFYNNQNLTKIEMSNQYDDKKIKTIPADLLKNNSKLNNFKFRNTMIEEIPNSLFSNTPALEFLDLERNQLKSISKDLLQNISSTIKSIHLGFNHITDDGLPVDLTENCTALKSFKIEHNKLTKFDTEMFRASKDTLKEFAINNSDAAIGEDDVFSRENYQKNKITTYNDELLREASKGDGSDWDNGLLVNGANYVLSYAEQNIEIEDKVANENGIMSVKNPIKNLNKSENDKYKSYTRILVRSDNAEVVKQQDEDYKNRQYFFDNDEEFDIQLNQDAPTSGTIVLSFSISDKAADGVNINGMSLAGEISFKYTSQASDRKIILSYDGNGNTSGDVPANQELDSAGDLVVADKGTLKKEGYIFVGWCTKEGSSNVEIDPDPDEWEEGGDIIYGLSQRTASCESGTLYLPGSTISISKDTTLHAQWQEIVKTNELIINDDFGAKDGIIVIYRTGNTSEKTPLFPNGFSYTYDLDLEIDGVTITDEQLKDVTWSIKTLGGFPSEYTYVTIDDGANKVYAKKSGVVELTATYNGSTASIKVVIPGDVTRDGLIAGQDGIRIQKYSASNNITDLGKDDEYTLLLADMNGDNVIAGQDANIIMRMFAGVITPSN
ncbi:hypothetical protein OKW22_001013 [Bacilli bacterium PM5-3]|nr:hypothetical protein [Bacilli bacterium PM5-3]